MANKILIYIAGILLVLLVFGSLFIGFKSGKIIEENDDIDLSRYRSEEIPKDCQLPEYENNVESWKEHLSHHENTLYCLDYYN